MLATPRRHRCARRHRCGACIVGWLSGAADELGVAEESGAGSRLGAPAAPALGRDTRLPARRGPTMRPVPRTSCESPCARVSEPPCAPFPGRVAPRATTIRGPGETPAQPAPPPPHAVILRCARSAPRRMDFPAPQTPILRGPAEGRAPQDDVARLPDEPPVPRRAVSSFRLPIPKIAPQKVAHASHHQLCAPPRR